MKKMPILVSVAVSSMLLSAVVFASTPASDAQATPAKAPNRAEVIVAAACDAPAVAILADAQSWQNALGNKRAHDRAVILAKAGSDAASGCDLAGE